VDADYEPKHPDHLKFIEDMKEAELDVQDNRGRFFWRGPAVVVNDLQQALGATKVACQWDNMGRGWVVYPRAYDYEAEHPDDVR
jgi:hypothetical protein